MRNILLFALVILLGSCSKTDYQVVPGNEPTPDEAINEITVHNYINRVYITLLGRKANTSEFNLAKGRFESDRNDKKARELLIDDLLQSDEFRNNLVFRARLKLIEGVDSASIARDYQLLLLQIGDSSLAFFRPFLELNKLRMEKLMLVSADYLNEVISLDGLHRRFVDNPYYDDINMGTENFVVSMFQHFLDRYPTVQELESGKRMVDGQNSSLFLIGGSSKDDFLNIFFNSFAYVEGRIHQYCRETMFRKATTEEILHLTPDFMSSKSPNDVIRYFLSSNEYFLQ